MQRTLMAGALTALLGAAGVVNANTIDLFTQPNVGAQVARVGGAGAPVPADQYFNNDGSIIGNYRDLSITNVSGTTTTRRSQLAVDAGRLQFSNDVGVAATGVIQWDGNDNPATLDAIGLRAEAPPNPDGFQGVNLVHQPGCGPNDGPGCSFFRTAVFFADQDFDVEIGVYTDATTFSLLRFTTAAVDNPGGVFSDFLFSWFDTAGAGQDVGGGFIVDVVHGATGKANFMDVGALQLRLNTGIESGITTAVDLDIGAITKEVPEPSALALAGIALLGAGMARRRQKAQQA